MTDLLQVKNKKNYYRNVETKNIIINDEAGLKKAKELKARLNKREEEIQDLKDQVKDLKELVLSLVEDKNGCNNN